jgi:hypothetical protein
MATHSILDLHLHHHLVHLLSVAPRAVNLEDVNLAREKKRVRKLERETTQ